MIDLLLNDPDIHRWARLRCCQSCVTTSCYCATDLCVYQACGFIIERCVALNAAVKLESGWQRRMSVSVQLSPRLLSDGEKLTRIIRFTTALDAIYTFTPRPY
jgi:hypothetical protein